MDRIWLFSALKEPDQISWNIAHSKWIDSEVSDGNLITFDNCSSYYWRNEIEELIAKNAS